MFLQSAHFGFSCFRTINEMTATCSLCRSMCPVVDCHQIDTLYQSIVGITVTYVNASTNTTYGSLVSATCRRGTVAVGNTLWQCDHSGLWSTPVNFQCHRKYRIGYTYTEFVCFLQYIFVSVSPSVTHVSPVKRKEKISA